MSKTNKKYIVVDCFNPECQKGVPFTYNTIFKYLHNNKCLCVAKLCSCGYVNFIFKDEYFDNIDEKDSDRISSAVFLKQVGGVSISEEFPVFYLN